MHLSDTAELGELAEHERDGLLHTPIRVRRDLVAPDPHVADRHRHEQLTAPGLPAQRFLRAVTQHGELHLAHRTLHAEQQAVIRQPRVVDARLVGQQAADQPTVVDQGMPFASVASQPRRLQRQHHPDVASAHGRQQPIIARTRRTPAGMPEIVIDHDHLVPTQVQGAVPERVLPALALVIVSNLAGRGLPNVDPGRTRQVLRRDPIHARLLFSPGPGSRSPPISERREA